MLSHLTRFNSFLFVFCVIFLSCKKDKDNHPVELTPYSLTHPKYFPKLNNTPADNPLTVEGINLGKKLYYDPILSNTGLSCSSCHNQSEAFSSLAVNSLPHINLAWNSNFLWDGKVVGSMEDIMIFEVEQFFNTDLNKINASEKYRNEFKEIYNVEVITSREIAYALAQFFRTLISQDARYDRFFKKEIMLNPSEMRGYMVFSTEKGDCFHCHSLGLFTDNKFHNIGLDSTFNTENQGRYNVTGNNADLGLFKTPTLRNIAMTSPYMHDGRFKTLEEVILHYDSGINQSITLDPIMTKPSKKFGLSLTVQDRADLVAFLKTLTDSTFLNNPAFKAP